MLPSFIHPELLALLLVIPLLWAAALADPRRVSRRRRAASLGLRTAIAAALVLALSGAQLSAPPRGLTTIFLLDGSDSVALAQRARGETYIQSALAAMPPDDRAGVVVFGARPVVERQPSADAVFGQVTAEPAGSATDIGAAIQLAAAMLPAEGGRRLVLISDGGETEGDARAAARQAAALGIPVDVVALSGAVDGADAQVAAVELPAATRAGQRPRMRLSLSANRPMPARLTVEGPGGAIVVDQQVALAGGEQALEVLLPEPPPGFNRYTVRLRAEGDVRTENNAAEAFTFTAGPPRLLVVEGASGEGEPLARALRAGGLEATVVAPSAAPRQVLEIASYDAVVLVDVPRRALADETLSAISQSVHDLGRGLMMVGGPQGFGAGGWADTPVEAVLPVTMDIPPILQVPPVSVVVVIDTSGSMGEEEGGRTKLSLAVEGAQRIASLLRDEDEITVIPFDEAPRDVVGPLPGTRRQEAVQALTKVRVGGGGITIHDALTEAARAVRASTHKVRHIITITDGGDTEQQEGALDIVRQLRAEGVTLTTVAIGSGGDVPFIQSAASAGGGRTYLTERASTLPSLLVDETQAILKPYIVEQDFAPALGAPHPALRLGASAPPLHGLVLTTLRPGAQALLTTPDGQVVMAAWQSGLGRSIAWTSDMAGRWGRDWVAWDGFPAAAARMAAWLLPTGGSGGLELDTGTSAGLLTLDARASDSRGAPLSGAALTATLYGSGDQPAAVELREVSPGRYRAAVADQPAGAYLVQLTARDSAGAPLAVLTAGAVVPLSAEYRRGAADTALLGEVARITGGRVGPPPAEAFAAGGPARGQAQEVGLWLLWLALALLPLDVAVRRLRWRPGQPRARAAGVPEPAPERPRPAPADPTPRQKPEPAPRRRGREEELERLRAEQERARRRARGEEE